MSDGGVAHFAGAGHEGEADGAAGGVAGGPAFARAGVGRVAIGAEALAVDPGVARGVDGLVAGEAEQLADDGGGGDFDEDDVIEADLVEGVFKGDAALDFVGLDHGGEDVAHGERRLAVGDCGAGEPVGDGEDGAEIVGGVAPLGGEPGVVEVEPADDGADVEGGLHGVELVAGAGDARAVGDDGAGDDGAEELGAGGIFEGFKAAAERVDEAVLRGGVGEVAFDLVVERVVGDVGEDFVGGGAVVADVGGHAGSLALS